MNYNELHKLTDDTTVSSSSSTSKYADQSSFTYNKLAMENFKCGNYDICLNYLNQALTNAKAIKESHVKHKLLATTYNNYGLLFKKVNRFPEAIQAMLNAIEIEKNLPNELINIAKTHLNICEILSALGDHERGLRHGLASLYMLRNNFVNDSNFVTTLVISYHNVGVEYEHLQQFKDAVECYTKGWEISRDSLGMKNQLTLALRKSLIECSGQDLYYFQKEEKKIPYEMLKSVSPRKNPKLLPNVSKERTKSHENRKNKAVVALPINYLKKRIEVVTTGRSTPTSIQGTLNKAINNTTSTKTKKNFFNESRRHSRPMSIERKSDNSNSIMSKSPKNSSQELGCSDYLHKEKKIDLERHKRQEKTAATMIQAWWRGNKAKKMYKELILTKELNHAALEAKKAVQTYEKLKSQILQLKQYKLSKQKPKNNFRNRKFGLLPISENKEHDNEIIKIQSIVRMFVAKMKYKKAKASFIRNQR